jgi:LL-diaminopimelate aminotransferase
MLRRTMKNLVLCIGYRSPVHLNPILEQLGSYPIADIRERAAAREEAGLPVIDFSIGDPREPTPEFIARALKEGVPEVSQYPTTAGRRELRRAIADYLLRRHGVTVDPDTQVIPTSGSKEAIFNTPFAFIDKDARDLVVFPSPGYPIYERGALFAGAEIHRVVLGGDFVMRAGDIPPEAWERARLVWICTPHNPSGSVTSLDELRDLVAACRANDAVLLSDECYADTYEDEAYPGGPASVLQVAGDGLSDVLVYLSLSKRSGMTGYRSGAIVGDATAIAALKNLRSSTGTASADFIQAAAVAAWGDDRHAADRRAIFTAKRRILERAFIEADMEVVASRAGLYLWVAVGDDLAVTDALLEHGIVVSPGTFFGEGGEGYIRLALVPGLDECEAAAAALRGALT